MTVFGFFVCSQHFPHSARFLWQRRPLGLPSSPGLPVVLDPTRTPAFLTQQRHDFALEKLRGGMDVWGTVDEKRIGAAGMAARLALSLPDDWDSLHGSLTSQVRRAWAGVSHEWMRSKVHNDLACLRPVLVLWMRSALPIQIDRAALHRRSFAFGTSHHEQEDQQARGHAPSHRCHRQPLTGVLDAEA